MKLNFNIIRESNPDHFKRKQKKTLCVQTTQQQQNPHQQQQAPQQQAQKIYSSLGENPVQHNIRKEHKKFINNKTQKISFNVIDNKVKNVFYPELKGQNITKLKEELINEENEEDNGCDFVIDAECVFDSTNTKNMSTGTNKSFVIEDMPEINITF